MTLRAHMIQDQTKPPQLDKIADNFARLVNAKLVELNISTIHNADQIGMLSAFSLSASLTISNEQSLYSTNTCVFAFVATFLVSAQKNHRWKRSAHRLGQLRRKEQRASNHPVAQRLGREKFEPFVVFKTPRSTVEERHEKNMKDRHGFGKVLWREMEPLQAGLQIYGNTKGVFMLLV